MSTPRCSAPLASLAAACLCTLLACTADDGGDTGTSTASAAGNTDAPATNGSTGPVGESTGEASTGAASSTDAASTQASTGEAPTTGAGESSTGPAPTDGPGVLPGETGLDAFCRRYVECGGTYYQDAQACIDESLGYWGECASRRAALDDFGACMSALACREWSPDAYNPASTPCAQQWQDLGASEACN